MAITLTTEAASKAAPEKTTAVAITSSANRPRRASPGAPLPRQATRACGDCDWAAENTSPATTDPAQEGHRHGQLEVEGHLERRIAARLPPSSKAPSLVSRPGYSNARKTAVRTSRAPGGTVTNPL